MSLPATPLDSKLDPDARRAIQTYVHGYLFDLTVAAYEQALLRKNAMVREGDVHSARAQLTPAPVVVPPARFERFRGRVWRGVILFVGVVGGATLEIGLEPVLTSGQPPSGTALLGAGLAAWAIWKQVTLGERRLGD